MSIATIRAAANEALSGLGSCASVSMHYLGAGKGHRIELLINQTDGAANVVSARAGPGERPEDAVARHIAALFSSEPK